MHTPQRRLNSRKCLTLTVLLGWSLTGDHATAQEAGSQEAQRSAQRLAAVTAARAALRDLEDLDLSEIETAWSETILREPTVHRSTAQSRQILSQEYMAELQQRLDDRLERIHASFNPVQNPERWFTREWLVEHVMNRFGDDIRTRLDANRQRHFAPLYEHARDTAVQGQLADLSLSTYPNAEEVDQVNEANWADGARQRLQQLLIERMGSGTPLLEETAHELQRVAGEILNDARAQYEAQAAALDRPVPPQEKTAEGIDRVLVEHVAATRQALKLARGPDEPVYRVFPSIERRRRERAKELEKLRFEVFARAYRFADLEPRVRKLLEVQSSAHRELVKSRQVCLQSLMPSAAEEMVLAYGEGAGEAFGTRLHGFISDVPEIREALSSRLESALEPVLGKVRGELAQRQLDEHFPDVSSDKWQVPENTLIEIHHQQLGIASFEDFVDLPFVGHGGKSYQRPQLLEETEQLALSRISKLLHEGERAWNSQLRMVSAFEETVESAIRKKVEERTPEQWEIFFFGEFETQWQEERMNRVWRGYTERPLHANEKYVGVFGHVQEELRDLVRRHYELAKQAEEERAQVTQIQGDASEPATKSEDSPAQTAGPGVPGGARRVDRDPRGGGGSSGSGGSGKGGNGKGGSGKGGGCIVPVMKTLLFLLLLTAVILLLIWLFQHEPSNLPKAAAVIIFVLSVLVVVLMFLMLMTSGVRIQVDAGELEGLKAELTRVVGAEPKVTGEREVVFDLGLLNRLTIEERPTEED